MKFYGIAAITICLAVSSCSTTRFPAAEFPRSNADLSILATQTQIQSYYDIGDGSEVEASTIVLASGGLVGIGIAGVIDRVKFEATETIEPLQEHLSDYEIRERFLTHIQGARITDQLVVGTDPVIRHSSAPNSRQLSRPHITIEPQVRLSSDMRSLLVYIDVEEFDPRDRFTPSHAEFTQSYRFIWPLENGYGLSRREAVAEWMEYPKEELIALIEMGMQESTGMLEMHLDQQTPVLENSDEAVRLPATGRFFLWRKSGEIFWFAKKSGQDALLAVPEHAIGPPLERDPHARLR
jgi:hypothetical protein